VGNVIGFFIGLTAGATFGAVLMGLMVAAGDYDRREEEEMHGSDRKAKGD